MKVVDANVLIYSVDESSIYHLQARQWMDNALSSNETVVIPWICLLAFIRITTNRNFNQNPLTFSEALDYVDDWLGTPPVTTETLQTSVASELRQLIDNAQGGSNIVNDAYLAALAILNKAELVSFDRDFSRFPGLTWVVP